MTVLLYGRRYNCDACGTEAEGEPMLTQAVIFGTDVVLPAGWYGGPLILGSEEGKRYQHFCPRCATLSLRQLGVMIAEHDRQAEDAE